VLCLSPNKNLRNTFFLGILQVGGCTFTDLHFSYRMGILTVSKIVEEVCTAIWCIMREDCIPTPTTEMWELIIIIYYLFSFKN